VALSLTAGGDMHITGTLSTSGQGPLDGPGAPSDADMGNGGTYGGSGGILDCHDDYYTAPAQVWTFVMFTAFACGSLLSPYYTPFEAAPAASEAAVIHRAA
jgi:hypothetical protein